MFWKKQVWVPAAPPPACRLQNGSDVTEGQWEVFGIQTSDAVTIPPVHFLYEGLFFFPFSFSSRPSVPQSLGWHRVRATAGV